MKLILTFIALFFLVDSFAQTVSISSKNKIIINDNLSGSGILTLNGKKLKEFKWDEYTRNELPLKVKKGNYKKILLSFSYTENNYINDAERINKDIIGINFSKNWEIAKLILVILDKPDPDGLISMKIAKAFDGEEFEVKGLTPKEIASMFESYIKDDVVPNVVKEVLVELGIISKGVVNIIDWYIKIMTISVLYENIQAFDRQIDSKRNLLSIAKKRYNISGRVDDFLKKFTPQVKYQLAIEVIYPFGVKYKYLANELMSDSKLQKPWGLRLTNYWKDYSGSGWYLPLAYSQSPFLYTKPESADTLFKSEGYSGFKHIDMLLGYNLRLWGDGKVSIFGNLELGARASFIESSKYLFTNNKISDVQRTSSFAYDQTSAILNVGVMLDFRFVQLNIKHSNTIANRGEGKKDRKLNAKYFQAGIQIPIAKGYRFIPK